MELTRDQLIKAVKETKLGLSVQNVFGLAPVKKKELLDDLSRCPKATRFEVEEDSFSMDVIKLCTDQSHY